MRHGSNIDPPNRFEQVQFEREWDEDFCETDEWQPNHRQIEYVDDQSKTVVATNKSPDLPFNFSLNPYRGCIHGCAYCYARPGHEYLGFNAGLDFETKIVVKRQAPELLRKFLTNPSWVSEPISFSGVTDCYQPAERKFKLTRRCLQVVEACNQPISIVTKNALIKRDLDILGPMAQKNLVHVYVSITTLDPELARDMEPRTSTPDARLRTIEQLANAGIPNGVMVAPVIPGLNDSEIPQILASAREAGAQVAGTVLLRLPLTVRPVFEEWIQRVRPNQAEMILGRIKQTRQGKLNDSQFTQRMKGTGLIAEQIRLLFDTFKKQLGFNNSLPAHNCTDFVRPEKDERQQRLF